MILSAKVGGLKIHLNISKKIEFNHVITRFKRIFFEKLRQFYFITCILFFMALDVHDLRILELIQQNAQLTIKEIAARVHLTQTPVHERLRKLEKEGYIERYAALLNRKKIGKSLLVYCQVTLDKQRKESFEEFDTAIQGMPSILECSLVSGNFDYLLKIVADDVDDYNRFYQQKLSVLKSVLHISSFFVMSEVKATTCLPLGTPS